MNAEVICVGTELLMGNVVNTNATRVSALCTTLGINVYHQSVVGDNHGRLLDAIDTAFRRSDCIFLCGGLGPTYDDITKETVAEYLKLDLVFDDRAFRQIDDFFKAIGHEMADNNRKQAYIIEGSQALYNSRGTAPGIYLEYQGKIVILLPGPPYELEGMLAEWIAPLLLKKHEGVIVSKTIHIYGMGESLVETKLLDLMESGLNPSVAPYAKTGEVEIRVSAKAADEGTALGRIDPVLHEIERRLGDVIYGIDVANLAQALKLEIQARQIHCSLYDGFTYGQCAQRLGEVPGVGMDLIVEAAASHYPTPADYQRFGLEKAQELLVEGGCAVSIVGNYSFADTDVAFGEAYFTYVDHQGSAQEILHFDRHRRNDENQIHYLAASKVLDLTRRSIKKGAL